MSEPLLLKIIIIAVTGDHMPVVFAPSSLCACNQTLWRNLQTVVLPQVFFAHTPWMIEQIVRI